MRYSTLLSEKPCVRSILGLKSAWDRLLAEDIVMVGCTLLCHGGARPTVSWQGSPYCEVITPPDLLGIPSINGWRVSVVAISVLRLHTHNGVDGSNIGK